MTILHYFKFLLVNYTVQRHGSVHSVQSRPAQCRHGKKIRPLVSQEGVIINALSLTLIGKSQYRVMIIKILKIIKMFVTS